MLNRLRELLDTDRAAREWSRTGASFASTGRGIVEGIKNAPYRFLGAPGDVAMLADMGLQKLGVLDEMPINPEEYLGSSDWMIRQAADAGIRDPQVRAQDGGEQFGQLLGEGLPALINPSSIGTKAARREIFAGQRAATAGLGAMRRAEERLDSLGRPVHHTPEGVENFGRWFGDSKVVDEAGNPLVVYHGTDSDIQEFVPSQGGTFGAGVYTTNDPNAASVFGESGNVIPLYARMENPYVVDLRGKSYEQKLQLTRPFKRRGSSERLAADGYDGVMFRDESGYSEIVPFSSSQVKSATGNSGAYSPSNPNITGSIDPQLAAWLGLGAAASAGAYTYNERN